MASLVAFIFSSITSGVLLTNFLLHLGASPVEIGMLSSISMLVNLLRGSRVSLTEQLRHWYCFVDLFGVAATVADFMPGDCG